MDINNIIDQFYDLKITIEEIDKEYKRLDKLLEDYKGLHIDMYHILEFSSLNAAEMVSLTSEYRKMMRKRRKVKRQLKILKQAKHFIHNYENMLDDLDTVANRMRTQMNKEMEYSARSIYGQELIDKYSEPGDGLIQSVDDFSELKYTLETNNVGCS